jgi:hypothetical protein
MSTEERLKCIHWTVFIIWLTQMFSTAAILTVLAS